MLTNLRQRIAVRDESGFTLIELLVVLIIIGVLLALAVPSYLGFKDRAEQAAAASDVRAAIPSAEAHHVENNSYASMDIGALKLIDSGLSNDIVTVSGTDATYCISANVGNWGAHVNGPRGTIVQKESSNSCP